MKVVRYAPLMLLLAAAPASGQQLAYGDTAVEILGLRTWSAEQVEAAVKRYAPNISLASAACAVILRDSVGFADAAVTTVTFPNQEKVWTIITVIEPEDSAFVRYTTLSRRLIEAPSEWEALRAALQADPGAMGYLQHPEFTVALSDSIFGQAVPASAIELRNRLRSLQSEGDRRRAVEILLHSSSPHARQLAALVASNFPRHDSTWFALVEALRARSDHGASTAGMVLGALARSGQFRVRWAPAMDALNAIMSGTNLFAYDKVLITLVETGVAQDLARALARQNPDLLVDHALARNPITPYIAKRFLNHLAPPTEPIDHAGWVEWIKSSG